MILDKLYKPSWRKNGYFCLTLINKTGGAYSRLLDASPEENSRRVEGFKMILLFPERNEL